MNYINNKGSCVFTTKIITQLYMNYIYQGNEQNKN